MRPFTDDEVLRMADGIRRARRTQIALARLSRPALAAVVAREFGPLAGADPAAAAVLARLAKRLAERRVKRCRRFADEVVTHLWALTAFGSPAEAVIEHVIGLYDVPGEEPADG